jgi:hypothetical protein
MSIVFIIFFASSFNLYPLMLLKVVIDIVFIGTNGSRLSTGLLFIDFGFAVM